MIGAARRMRRALRRLPGNQTGIAAVEFALIVPFLLLLYLGATDLTQALAVDRKLGQIATTVSDLVAQEASISQSQVNAFFEAGTAIMRPFDFDRTKLKLTIVRVDDGSARVTGAAERNWEIDVAKGEVYPLPQEMLDLSDGRYLVIATAGYAFQPLFGTVFSAQVDLEQQSQHIVRQEVTGFGF